MRGFKMADNNEGLNAISESLRDSMIFLNEVYDQNLVTVDSYKKVYDLTSAVIVELGSINPERYSKELKRYKNIQREMKLELQKNGVDDFEFDPDVTIIPDYIDQDIEQKLRLFNSIIKNDPISYNGRSVPEGIQTSNGLSIFTMDLIQDLESKLNTPRGNSELLVEGEEFYRESYKSVIEKSIELAKNNNSRLLQTFLGERNRVQLIDVVFEDVTDPIKDITIMNMDPGVDEFGERRINPETLIYYMERNHLDNEKNIVGVYDVDRDHSVRLLETKLLYEAVKENSDLLDSKLISSLSNIMQSIKEFEENLPDDSKDAYLEKEEAVKNEDIKFDNMSVNRNAIKKGILHDGYSPSMDIQGEWVKNSDMKENSIRIIADWEKKFEDKLLEIDGAYYDTFSKIKRRKFGMFGDIDYSNSSLFTVSMITKDEYGHPSSVLYNISRLNQKMEFTGAGLRSGGRGDPINAYEIAALNARKNGWGTVTLNFKGDPREGIEFMKKSIVALRESGNYTFDDIKVPRKYAGVLQKMKDSEFSMSEAPPVGEEEDYANVSTLEKEAAQVESKERKAARSIGDDSDYSQGESGDSGSESNSGNEGGSGEEEELDQNNLNRDAQDYDPMTSDEPNDDLEVPPLYLDDEVDALSGSQDYDPMTSDDVDFNMPTGFDHDELEGVGSPSGEGKPKGKGGKPKGGKRPQN
jgi:hypothetical protein